LVKQRGRHRRFDPDTRAQLAQRFRAMYRNLGLDLAGCAQLLHVTERTLHNWQSGKHDIPYAAYRLLRLLNRMELPGQSWDGWCFHGGKLWTPEGYSFVGTDGSWWSLLVRQANGFRELFERNALLERQLAAVPAGQARDARAGTAASWRAPYRQNSSGSPMVITGITNRSISYRETMRGAS
ncbi:VC1465 family Xer recombination activation factor, partial [Paracidovorax citrulli]